MTPGRTLTVHSQNPGLRTEAVANKHPRGTIYRKHVAGTTMNDKNEAGRGGIVRLRAVRGEG